jgi:hypothetical protein
MIHKHHPSAYHNTSWECQLPMRIQLHETIFVSTVGCFCLRVDGCRITGVSKQNLGLSSETHSPSNHDTHRKGKRRDSDWTVSVVYDHATGTYFNEAV